jgi:hypothetical protein
MPKINIYSGEKNNRYLDENKVRDYIDELFRVAAKEANLATGDWTPEQEIRLTNATETIMELLTEFVNNNR